MSGNQETEKTSSERTNEDESIRGLSDEAEAIRARYTTVEEVARAHSLEELAVALRQLYFDWYRQTEGDRSQPGLGLLRADMWDAYNLLQEERGVHKQKAKKALIAEDANIDPNVSPEAYFEQATRRSALRALEWQEEWRKKGEDLNLDHHAQYYSEDTPKGGVNGGAS